MPVQPLGQVQLQPQHSPHSEADDSYLGQHKRKQDKTWQVLLLGLLRRLWVGDTSRGTLSRNGSRVGDLMTRRMGTEGCTGNGWVSWLCPPVAV